MRLFNGLLFLGNGRTSVEHAQTLRARLFKAVDTLGGLQQGVLRDSPEYHETKAELEDVVRDVAAALLGRNIEFTDELPYPPPPEDFAAIEDYRKAFMDRAPVIERKIVLDYTNWEGERGFRTVIPEKVIYGRNEWHKVPQWILFAYDVDKKDHRSFAMESIHGIQKYEEPNVDNTTSTP